MANIILQFCSSFFLCLLCLNVSDMFINVIVAAYRNTRTQFVVVSRKVFPTVTCKIQNGMFWFVFELNEVNTREKKNLYEY